MDTTRAWIERLDRILEEEGITEIHYIRAAVLLGVSPSQAREILRAYSVAKKGWEYERGVLRRVEGVSGK